MVEQGDVLQKIVPNRIKRGQKLPQAIIDAPEILPGSELYYQAFEDLQTCRGGMGDGPIPWTAVKCYCDHHGFDTETADDVWFMVSRMDRAWATMKK